MPSVVVDVATSGFDAGGPVIAGVEFRRPVSASETDEPLQAVVQLGTGATRTYTKGTRRVYAFTWSKLLRAEVDALRASLAAPYVALRTDPTVDPVIVSTSEGVTVDKVPGTYPIRHTASVTLRERDPRT